jgi:hypothetical protein
MAFLPPGVFEQDGCIIDNQADHIVMTVRLPKSMIRENYALLVALTQASGGTVDAFHTPQSAERPKEKGTSPWLYAALILIAIGVPSPIFQGNSIFAHAAPPSPIVRQLALKQELATSVPLGFFAPRHIR